MRLLRTPGIEDREIIEMTGGDHFNEVVLTDVRSEIQWFPTLQEPGRIEHLRLDAKHGERGRARRRAGRPGHGLRPAPGGRRAAGRAAQEAAVNKLVKGALSVSFDADKREPRFTGR